MTSSGNSVATGCPVGASNGIDPTPSIVASTTTTTYPNPNNPNPNNLNPNWEFCLNLFICAIIGIPVAIVVFTSIFHVFVHPEFPTISVSSLNVTNFNLPPSSSSVSSSFDLSLSFYNPKSTIRYYDIFVFVTFHTYGTHLGRAHLAPFTQTMGNSTAISVKVTAVNVLVGSYVVDAIRSRGVVRLEVMALVRFRWTGAFWSTMQYDLKVFCRAGEVKFRNGGMAGDGAVTGVPRQCWMDLL